MFTFLTLDCLPGHVTYFVEEKQGGGGGGGGGRGGGGVTDEDYCIPQRINVILFILFRLSFNFYTRMYLNVPVGSETGEALHLHLPRFPHQFYEGNNKSNCSTASKFQINQCFYHFNIDSREIIGRYCHSFTPFLINNSESVASPGK